MWTVLANMPIATETKGEIVDGKLYIFGGYNENTSIRIDVYDIATDTWSSLGTLPEGISAHATTVIGSKIWLIGDYLNLESLAYYDISDNTFQYLLSNMNGRRRAAAEGVNGNLYVIGGNTGLPISTAIASVQVSDLMTLKTKNIAESVLSVFPKQNLSILPNTPSRETSSHHEAHFYRSHNNFVRSFSKLQFVQTSRNTQQRVLVTARNVSLPQSHEQFSSKF